MSRFIIEEKALVSLFNCLESFTLIHSGQVGNLITNVKNSLLAFNEPVMPEERKDVSENIVHDAG